MLKMFLIYIWFALATVFAGSYDDLIKKLNSNDDKASRAASCVLAMYGAPEAIPQILSIIDNGTDKELFTLTAMINEKYSYNNEVCIRFAEKIFSFREINQDIYMSGLKKIIFLSDNMELQSLLLNYFENENFLKDYLCEYNQNKKILGFSGLSFKIEIPAHLQEKINLLIQQENEFQNTSLLEETILDRLSQSDFIKVITIKKILKDSFSSPPVTQSIEGLITNSTALLALKSKYLKDLEEQVSDGK